MTDIEFEELVINVLRFRKPQIKVAVAVASCVDPLDIISNRCPWCGQAFKKRWSLLIHFYANHPRELRELVECASGRLRG